MDSRIARGHVSMLGANVMWGMMSPVAKFVLSAGMVGAFSLATFRMLGGAILFWIASAFIKKEEVSSRDMIALFFAALLGIVLNQGAFTVGVGLTSPINASIITTTSPILVMMIAALYLKEPVTAKKVMGIFTGAIGAMLLVISSQAISAESEKSGNIGGDLLCVFAQICFASYFVFFKSLISRYHPVTLMKWMFTYASICCIPFTYGEIASIDFVTLPVSGYTGIAFVVVGATFIAYLLIPVGQHYLRPTVACMYNYVQPIIAAIIAVLWGMDDFGWIKGMAVILVFSGVYMVTQSKTKAELEAEKQ